MKKILIISIIALVITLIGSTYAFFMYSKTTKAFTLTSGDINIEFVNGDNNINLTYAYPISDNYAKANLEKLGYVDFSVNGNIKEDKKVINYEIYLEEDSKNTLDSDYIKVYLTDDTNKEIVSPKTYNILDKTSYANSENGKVIYKTSKHGEFNDKYRIYVWIDSKYSQNVIQESFSFKVNLYAYNDNETAVSVIKSKLVKYEESSKDTFTGGLVAVNTDGELYNETDDSQTIREYRYSGPNVNNYVTFNDEVWRIIGVFKDEKGEEHVKIVRNEELNGIFPETYTINRTEYKIKGNYGAYWNMTTSGNYRANWATGGLQYWLNTIEDQSEEKKNRGYLSYLNENSVNMIKETKYYLGSVTNSSEYSILDTSQQAYINERAIDGCGDGVGPTANYNQTTIESNNTCRVWANFSASWEGKIALLYPSDIGFAGNASSWSNQLLYPNNNWIIVANQSCLLSPVTNTNVSIAQTNADKALRGYGTSYSYEVLPTLYLKSNVKITSGDGSQNNQYKLSLN